MNMSHDKVTSSLHGIDSTFIPTHLIERIQKNDNICNYYQRILERGRLREHSIKNLQMTVVALQTEDHENEMASSKEFQEVVNRRSFDTFGHPIRRQKMPNSCDEVLVSESSLMENHFRSTKNGNVI